MRKRSLFGGTAREPAPPVPRPRKRKTAPEPPPQPACELGECVFTSEGRGYPALRTCRRWGRCLESERMDGESDREWLDRTRPWVTETARMERRLAAHFRAEAAIARARREARAASTAGTPS